MKRLGLKYPLIVAPMAGGPSSVDLVTESSRAGALGSFGAAYSSPQAMSDFVGAVRGKTDRPIAINLFVPESPISPSPAEIQKALQATAPFRRELGLPDPQVAPPFEESFDAQFAAVLKLKPAVLSFVFGLLERDYLRAAKAQNIYVIGTATTLDEALLLEQSGVDAITLQGIEAGGHRGIFDAEAIDQEVGLGALLKSCFGKIKLPLIAAGGIMKASEVRAALSAGADAVQMGTAFLACKEAGTSAPYRKALLDSPLRKTKTTRVFSGRLARGLVNRFMLEMEEMGGDVILPFQAQNKFTRDLRGASAQNGSADFLSLWSGTGSGDLWQGTCAELIAALFQ